MPQFQWLNDERLVQDRVFQEMPKRVRHLFDQVSACDGALPLLRMLEANPNTFKTLEDLAYSVQQPPPAIETNLYTMVNLGLVQWMNVAGLIFFGLTSSPEQRQLVHDLCAWQDRWYDRLAHIEQVINGTAWPRPEPQDAHPAVQSITDFD
ncbi:MAG: hypothetical protein M1570_06340 [Chloroflexi bacterium]|nr:hypothetical protein [Chloroflexota bacterium]